MTDFDQFERRLAAALRSDADQSVDPFEAAQVARVAIAGTRPARRFGRGRGLTLLAAAALLLVGGALAAGSGFVRLPSVVPPVPEPSVVAVATASPDATSPSPSETAAPPASPIPVAGPGGVWIPTGSMVTPRRVHNAVRLLDGRVLVVGGVGASDGRTSPELYDPATGTWSATEAMIHPSGGFPATLLRDGTVLVADVAHESEDDEVQGAEVYDPATGTWTATGPMVRNADSGRVTVLQDGKVLAGSQLYDPASRTWTATGKSNIPGYGKTATLMSDGKVLTAGGYVIADPPHSADSAEVYDPVTGSWTAIANMQAPHSGLMATLLDDGKVLVVSQSGSEVYDPTTGTWTARAMPTAFGSPRALLSDETVLFAAIGNNPDACTAAALYDPRGGSLTTTSSMLRCGFESSFTLLLDGTVLKAGGRECFETDCGSAHTWAELYVPAGVPLPPLPAFASPPPAAFPSPTPVPTPLPPAAGPGPPNARSWKVTVDNESSEPVTLSVAEVDETGDPRLVGSATPNVVPAGATVQVTFLFPAEGGWIYVDLRPSDGGGLVSADQIGIPGKIWIPDDGEGGWVSP